jgi:hypothetical protein
VEALCAGFVCVPNDRRVVSANLRAASPAGSSAIEILDHTGWKRLHAVICSSRLNIHCKRVLSGSGEHEMSRRPKYDGSDVQQCFGAVRGYPFCVFCNSELRTLEEVLL